MIINLSDGHKTQNEAKIEREKKIALMYDIISLWDKKALQSYVYNKNKAYPNSDAGMAAILEYFIKRDELQVGTLAEELKTAFDIVLSIAKNHKISYQTTDLIYSFIKHFEEVIHFYDRQSAQTYYHKLIQAYESSVKMVNKKMEIEKEIRVKY